MKVLTFSSFSSLRRHREAHVKTSIRLTHKSPLAFPLSSLRASYFSPAVAHPRRLGEISQSQSILFDDSSERHRDSLRIARGQSVGIYQRDGGVGGM